MSSLRKEIAFSEKLHHNVESLNAERSSVSNQLVDFSFDHRLLPSTLDLFLRFSSENVFFNFRCDFRWLKLVFIRFCAQQIANGTFDNLLLLTRKNEEFERNGE